MKELAADVVVDVVELAVLHVEGKAALDIACGEQHSLGAAFGNLDIRRDAVRPVHHIGAGVGRHHLRAGIVGVAGASLGNLRTRIRQRAVWPRESTGRTLYLPASTYQVAIISISFARFSAAMLWFSAKSFSM